MRQESVWDRDDEDYDTDSELDWTGVFRWARNTPIWVFGLSLVWLTLEMVMAGGFDLFLVLSAIVSMVPVLFAVAVAAPVARLVSRVLRRLHAAVHAVVFAAMGVGIGFALSSVELNLLFLGHHPVGLAIIFACSSALAFWQAFRLRFQSLGAPPSGSDGLFPFLSGLRAWTWMMRG